jgi:hypothetical protein
MQVYARHAVHQAETERCCCANTPEPILRSTAETTVLVTQQRDHWIAFNGVEMGHVGVNIFGD